MQIVYEGVCENCGETAVLTTETDQTPNTCPFCGGSVEYNEVSETEGEWEE